MFVSLFKIISMAPAEPTGGPISIGVEVETGKQKATMRSNPIATLIPTPMMLFKPL